MNQCSTCGFIIENNNDICPNCGRNLENNKQQNIISSKNKRVDLAIILSICLPGISYFYLELWYRGILFYITYLIILINLSCQSALFDIYQLVNEDLVAYLILFIYFFLYIFQIIDIINKTR